MALRLPQLEKHTALRTIISLLLIFFQPLVAVAVDKLPLNQRQTLDDLALELSLERFEYRRGERFKLTIVSETPRNVIVQFEAIDEEFGEFKIISRHPTGATQVDELRHHWQRQYVLDPIRTGELAIPALGLVFYTTEKPLSRTPCLDGQCLRISNYARGPEIEFAHTQRDMATLPLTISVQSLPVQEGQPLDPSFLDVVEDRIAPLSTVPVYWRWLAALGLIILLVVLIAILRKGKQQRQHVLSSAPESAKSESVDAADLSARAQLASLQQDDLIDQKPADELYSQLGVTLRTPLAKYYGDQVIAKTSAELLALLQTGPMAGQRDMLAHLLRQYEEVCYAAYVPSRNERETFVSDVEKFIFEAADS